MIAMRQVFAPVDGSAVSSDALDFAIERAKLHGADVTVGFAVNRASVATSAVSPYAYMDPTPLLDALEAEAVAVLDAAEARVKAAGLTARRATIDGAAIAAILAYERQEKPDVIIMGTHGRRGLEGLVIGSTAHGVVRRSGVPVMVVPPNSAGVPPGPLGCLLVAVDGSPAATRGLDFACELARSEGARLTLCGVAEDAEAEHAARKLLDESVARVASAGLDATPEFLRGPAAECIVSSAQSCGAGAIVMGTHGRAGIPRFVLGSVAEAVLRLSPVPVCTVRHR